MNDKQLLDLKQQIDQAKTKVATLQGRKEGLEQDLQDNWQCASIEAGKKMLTKWQADINKLDNLIETKKAEIERKYYNA